MHQHPAIRQARRRTTTTETTLRALEGWRRRVEALCLWGSKQGGGGTQTESHVFAPAPQLARCEPAIPGGENRESRGGRQSSGADGERQITTTALHSYYI